MDNAISTYLIGMASEVDTKNDFVKRVLDFCEASLEENIAIDELQDGTRREAIIIS